MKTVSKAFLIAIVTALFTGAVFAAPPERDKDAVAFRANRLLGRGVNLGNALEAPREGGWGVVLKEAYFNRIREAGFNSVRIPIRWSAHAQDEPPYTIDETFFERVDWAIDQALARDLAVIINMHHYDELANDPAEHRRRFLAIWKQISDRYRQRPPTLFFELLNEPHDQLTADQWNDLLRATLTVIRGSNPKRIVVVGPVLWNNIEALDQLTLPEDDRRLIVTVHYYLPFPFTHQGANWIGNSGRWLGTKWTGSAEEKEAIRKDFDTAANWAKRRDRPLFLGEFGAYSKAEMPSRARWTQFVREEAEAREMATAYWEFCAGFGLYNREANAWRKPLLDALIPSKD